MLTRVKVNINFDLLLYMPMDSKRCECEGVTRVLVLSCHNLKKRPDPGIDVMSECEGVNRVLAVFGQNVKGWPGFWLFSIMIQRGHEFGLFLSQGLRMTPGSNSFCPNVKRRPRLWLFLSEGGGWPGFLLPAASPSSCDKYKCQSRKGMDGWG